MFSLISSSLSSTVSRFLTFELGAGNFDKLKKVFSTAILIHLVLAGAVLILSETLGVWFLNTHLVVPASRLYAANWVFQASIAAFILGLLTVPYNASIVSHERMKAFAYVGITDVVFRLLIVLFLAYAPWKFDRLIVYSLLLVGVGIFFQCILFSYCKKHFEECRFKLSFDRLCWKEMSAFAGWNFIGCTAGLLKGAGVDILLNLFVGPVLNAARGIAGSVNNAVSAFAGNFMAALNPQIIKSYASGHHIYMMSLVERGSRFSFYILLVLALPILLETDFVLTLWLKQYPDHTVNFVRLVMILSMCNILSNTLINLQVATGKIRNYQLAVGGVLMLNFPLSYICLKLGFPPESTLGVAVFISLCCLILRLYFLRYIVELSMKRYLKNVCLNVFTVSLIALIVPVLVYSQLSEGWLRFIVVSITCVLSSMIVIYRIGCTVTERQFILNRIVELKNRLFR